MKNIIKTGAYSLVALGSVAYTNVAAEIKPYDSAEIESGLKGDPGTGGIGKVIQDLIQWALGFLGLIAIILVIWAGFNIMTAGGDDDKVKKGKTTIINALIGIFVIFIAWQIVDWIFSAFNGLATS